MDIAVLLCQVVKVTLFQIGSHLLPKFAVDSNKSGSRFDFLPKKSESCNLIASYLH